ncbi:MAG TPA: hypothetical protein VGA96_06730 [Fibrella sp.]
MAKDGPVLTAARESAQIILETDPNLILPEHAPIRNHIEAIGRKQSDWSRIS